MTSFQTGRTVAVRAILMAALAALALASPALSKTTKTPTPGKPQASTGGVSHQGSSSQLQGTVNPGGHETTYFFQYGPTLAYGSQTTPASVGSGLTNVKVGQTVTGVLTGYHYRIVARSSAGEAIGKDRIFTTSKKKLSITFPKTKTADRITGYGGSYTLSGTLTGQGNANHAVQLETQPYPYSGAFTPGPTLLTNAAGAFSFHIADMRQNTKFRVQAPGARPVISSDVVVGVAVRVTVHVRSVAHVGLARVYGTVSPAAAGQAMVQLLKPGKESGKHEASGPKPQTVGATKLKRATRSLSRFSAVVTIRQSGNYRVYVKLGQGPLSSGYSQDVKIRTQASPSKGKGKRKSASK